MRQATDLSLPRRLRERARSHMGFAGWLEFGFRRDTCGSELAHESVEAGESSVSDTLPSRASPLPHEVLRGALHLGPAAKPVGVSLLTKASVHVNHLCLTHCLREQARSHMGFAGWLEFGFRRETCGSGLAHEGIGQANHLCLTYHFRERARSHMRFAGWLAFGFRRETCGSGLAHESVSSGGSSVSDTLPSRASSLPQGICGVS